jgi:hypothetical protein
MAAPKDFEALLDPYAALAPSPWDEHLARWISRVASPPFVAASGVILSVQTIGTAAAWLWAGFYLLLVISLPAGYVFWLVRRGEVTDFDLRLREQRLRPFLATLSSAIIAWLALFFGDAPYLLVVLAGAAWVQIALLFGITLRWKISAHCTTAAGFVVLTWALFGSAAAPLVLTIPLVAWSRLRLRRHDLPQTLAGIFLGSAILGAALYFAI